MCRIDILKNDDYRCGDISPLKKLFECFPPPERINLNADLAALAAQLRQNGYIRSSFVALRNRLINENHSYNLETLACLMHYALPEGLLPDSIQPVSKTEATASWLYEKNIIEYINIRALGVNNTTDKCLRTGNFLDFIIYILQSRSEVFHIAPFHKHIENLIYSPTDMYSIMDSLISPELTKVGFSAFEQLKLVLDFGHAQKIRRAFLIDTLPHTGQMSVNYIYNPTQAHWISLNKDTINTNKRLYRAGKSLIKKIIQKNVADITPEELESCFSLDKQELIKLLSKNASKPAAKRQELLENSLCRRLVKKTGMVSNNTEKDFLMNEATKAWNNNASFQATSLITPASHHHICDEITSIIRQKLGENYTYKDIQASEENYSGSIAKQLREKEYVYNLPVGPWDGGELELIAFHISYNRPVFACKSFQKRSMNNGNKEKFYDVSKHCFDSISRRQFRLPSGKLNIDAMNEFIEIYSFYLGLGFDGLRIDQVDNVYYKSLKDALKPDQSMIHFFSNNSYSYDTILQDDLRLFISELRRLEGDGTAILLEDMMHFPVYQLSKVFNRMNTVGANTIIGHFQFMENIPKLLIRIQEHNLTRMYQQAESYVLNTIECHDNDMTLGGTSPCCKDAGGPEKLRLRMLLNSIGLPYSTMQSLNAVNCERSKDYQMQYSINNAQNLNFKTYKKYTIGKIQYQFDTFRHNFFNFISIPEVKQILKGGIIKVHNGKLTDNTKDGVFAVSVHNNSPGYLLFVFNSSNQDLENVIIKNVMLDWYEGERDVLYFDLDQNGSKKLSPEAVSLKMYNENGKRQALQYDLLCGYELKVYLISEQEK